MNLLENRDKRIIVAIITLGMIFLVVKTDILIEKEDIDIITESEIDIENTNREIESTSVEEIEIMIHLGGEVNSPGLIKLKKGDRLIDAIEIAGGLTRDADLNTINLARKLQDEEKIHIPKFGEIVNAVEDTANISKDIVNSSDGLINIKTCSKSDLMNLPGVGDKTADKIIEYRENNPFNSIEDLKNIAGIGDKKYEAIKDFIEIK